MGEEALYEVVLADDDSPDGTWEKAEELSEEYPGNAVRRRGERGWATAVLRGVEEAKGNFILVMDADHQHPPPKGSFNSIVYIYIFLVDVSYLPQYSRSFVELDYRQDIRCFVFEFFLGGSDTYQSSTALAPSLSGVGGGASRMFR